MEENTFCVRSETVNAAHGWFCFKANSFQLYTEEKDKHLPGVNLY